MRQPRRLHRRGSEMPSGSRASSASSAQVGATSPTAPGSPVDGKRDVTRRLAGNVAGIRSEEHTSELQSLMRISYAVFCLKKKKRTRRTDCRSYLINKHTT